MTQEEKELLLKDLCARLPYNIKVNITYSKEHGSSYRLRICSEGCLTLNTDLLGLYIEDEIYLKPYLRPISSITEEEEREVNGLLSEVYDFTFGMDELLELIQMQKEISFHYINWLNEHHFDYRDLIPMGLALEAPEDMYK